MSLWIFADVFFEKLKTCQNIPGKRMLNTHIWVNYIELNSIILITKIMLETIALVIIEYVQQGSVYYSLIKRMILRNNRKYQVLLRAHPSPYDHSYANNETLKKSILTTTIKTYNNVAFKNSLG